MLRKIKFRSKITKIGKHLAIVIPYNKGAILKDGEDIEITIKRVNVLNNSNIDIGKLKWFTNVSKFKDDKIVWIPEKYNIYFTKKEFFDVFIRRLALWGE